MNHDAATQATHQLLARLRQQPAASELAELRHAAFEQFLHARIAEAVGRAFDAASQSMLTGGGRNCRNNTRP
jgi:hypothetical protein